MANVSSVLSENELRMGKSVEALRRELASIRTGRASPDLIEHIVVNYYGTPTPINQIASISSPEARLLLIQPWDRQSIADIKKGILKSDLGLTPISDGNLIRLSIPILTEERRKELVRLVRKKGEDYKIAIRNIRRNALDRLRTLEREKIASQDENRRAQEQLQKLTDSFIGQVDSLLSKKETEVLEI